MPPKNRARIASVTPSEEPTEVSPKEEFNEENAIDFIPGEEDGEFSVGDQTMEEEIDFTLEDSESEYGENEFDPEENRMISFKAILKTNNLMHWSDDLSIAVASVSAVHIIVRI